MSADYGSPIHYTAVRRGTPVYDADGVRVGAVRRVADNYREHILDGYEIDDEQGTARFVDAPEVARLFDRHADLFPIRPQGGCYFTPHRHAAFVDQIQELLNHVGGRLLRFPVPAGTGEGDRSVTQAVADGLAAVVAEHRAAVSQFGADTRGDTLERAAEKIRATRFKLAAYAEYLAGEKERLERAVAEAERELREKVEQIASVPA